MSLSPLCVDLNSRLSALSGELVAPKGVSTSVLLSSDVVGSVTADAEDASESLQFACGRPEAASAAPTSAPRSGMWAVGEENDEVGSVSAIALLESRCGGAAEDLKRSEVEVGWKLSWSVLRWLLQEKDCLPPGVPPAAPPRAIMVGLPSCIWFSEEVALREEWEAVPSVCVCLEASVSAVRGAVELKKVSLLCDISVRALTLSVEALGFTVS